jgi:uncharacterized membrane protein
MVDRSGHGLGLHCGYDRADTGVTANRSLKRAVCFRMVADSKRMGDSKARAADSAQTDANRAAVIEQTFEAIMAMHAQDVQRLHRHQRAIERMASVFAAPTFLFGALATIAIWVGVNGVLYAQGRRVWDHPPFGGLQTALTVLSLAMTLIVVSTQRRQGSLAERNAHLDLQLSLLLDQKATKLILLLEEMRADSPNLPDRSDPEVVELTASTDPAAVAQWIAERLTENLEIEPEEAESATD